MITKLIMTIKKVFIAIFCLFLNTQSYAQSLPDHQVFTQLLQKYVNEKGEVDYAGIKKNEASLDLYLAELQVQEPTIKWPVNDRLCFWINAYNAFTIKLILDHWNNGQLKSIKEIGSTIKIPMVSDGWSFKFIKIGGKKYSLNNIEHDIIRKQYAEARIHAALVCAAKSCPKLRREAYEPSKLHAQLDAQMVDFLNDTAKNKVEENAMKLSSILNWYGSDFTKKMPLINWVNKYSKVKCSPNATIGFLDYDWSLNVWKK